MGQPEGKGSRELPRAFGVTSGALPARQKHTLRASILKDDLPPN
jgi:hypothetical protein